MLPDNLVSIYKEYKEDTNAVASWLASTAKSCGYPSDLLGGDPPQATGRLKGKARKEAKAAAAKSQGSSSSSSRPDYTIAIKDFILLAEFVAASKKPVVSVPLAFANTLDRVIATRSRFSNRLAQTGASNDASANSTHSYFVGVLEKVREVLKPRFPPASQDAASARPPSDPVGEVGGRFANLSVYEPSEEFLNAPDIERPAPVKKENVNYVAESLRDLDEVLFAYTLLINDLMVIRNRIQVIWTNYRETGFDVVAAAVATNTACDLARHMMEDMGPSFKAHGGVVRVGRMFYMVQCLMNGFSREDLNKPGVEFNYDTYDIADDTYMIPYMMLEDIVDNLGPDPNVLPLYKLGLNVTYDPTPDWETMPMKEKYAQDTILIMNFITDVFAIVRAIPGYPVHDEFTRGIEELDRTREVPMYLVFAAQVFLDIHHILRGKVYSAQELLMSHLELMDEDLALQLDFHAKVRAKKSTAYTDETMNGIRKLIKSVQEDPIHRVHAQSYVPDGTSVNVPMHRLLKYSPVISGLMLYQFRATVYRLGLRVADGWGSILYPLHLYSALLKENLVSPGQAPEECWDDMYAAEGLLGRDSFFVGSQLPQNRREYVTKLGLQIGVSANTFAFMRRKGGRAVNLDNIASKSGRRGIKLDAAAVSDMFFDRYVRNTGQVDWTPEHVDRVISRSMWDVVRQGESNLIHIESITDPEKLRERKKKIAADEAGKKVARPGAARTAPGELVTKLFLSLAAEAHTMMFPYMTLHRAAWIVLHAVEEACGPKLLQMYGCCDSEDESLLPQVVTTIFMALDSGDDRLILKAAEAVKEQLRRGEGARALQRLQAMGCTIVLHRNGEAVHPPMANK